MKKSILFLIATLIVMASSAQIRPNIIRDTVKYRPERVAENEDMYYNTNQHDEEWEQRTDTLHGSVIRSAADVPPGWSVVYFDTAYWTIRIDTVGSTPS